MREGYGHASSSITLVEHVLSMSEALGSVSSTKKEREAEREKAQERDQETHVQALEPWVLIAAPANFPWPLRVVDLDDLKSSALENDSASFCWNLKWCLHLFLQYVTNTFLLWARHY